MSIAYSSGNKCAKSCCKRTILFQLIVEIVVTCFLEHSVYSSLIHFQYYRCLLMRRSPDATVSYFKKVFLYLPLAGVPFHLAIILIQYMS